MLVRLVLAVFLLVLSGVLAAGETPMDEAAGVISRLHSALGALAEDDEPDVDERFRRIESVIIDSHNLSYISRLMLRNVWDSLSSAQRQEFREQFTRLSVMDYASRFGDVSQESFKIKKVTALSETRVRVIAQLSTSERDLQFIYTLDLEDRKWRIVSVLVNGVSQLALRRSEYNRILNADGFDALIEHIKQQIDTLRNS